MRGVLLVLLLLLLRVTTKRLPMTVGQQFHGRVLGANAEVKSG